MPQMSDSDICLSMFSIVLLQTGLGSFHNCMTHPL